MEITKREDWIAFQQYLFYLFSILLLRSHVSIIFQKLILQEELAWSRVVVVMGDTYIPEGQGIPREMLFNMVFHLIELRLSNRWCKVETIGIPLGILIKCAYRTGHKEHGLWFLTRSHCKDNTVLQQEFSCISKTAVARAFKWTRVKVLLNLGVNIWCRQEVGLRAKIYL